MKMKKILFLSLILLSSNLFGQIEIESGVETIKRAIYSENDTIPIVRNLKSTKEQNNILYFLNGKQINEQVISTINPKKIANITVDKESVELKKANRKSKIYIKTKDSYIPNLVSLNELKAKYLNLTDKYPILFMLDEKIINLDYDEFKVDEKYILKMEVQYVENSKEKVNIIVVRLITRTKENIEKANAISIRGNGF